VIGRPGLNGESIAVSLFSASSQVPFLTSVATADGNGQITLQGLTPGTVDIQVKQRQALSRRTGGVVLAQDAAPAAISVLTLSNGDVDNNDQVDIVDFSLLRSAFGSTTPCGGQGVPGQPCADLDASTIVDIVDFSLLRASFGQSGPLLF
jgi:hypothetical protein